MKPDRVTVGVIRRIVLDLFKGEVPAGEGVVGSIEDASEEAHDAQSPGISSFFQSCSQYAIPKALRTRAL